MRTMALNLLLRQYANQCIRLYDSPTVFKGVAPAKKDSPSLFCECDSDSGDCSVHALP